MKLKKYLITLVISVALSGLAQAQSPAALSSAVQEAASTASADNNPKSLAEAIVQLVQGLNPDSVDFIVQLQSISGALDAVNADSGITGEVKVFAKKASKEITQAILNAQPKLDKDPVEEPNNNSNQGNPDQAAAIQQAIIDAVGAENAAQFASETILPTNADDAGSQGPGGSTALDEAIAAAEEAAGITPTVTP